MVFGKKKKREKFKMTEPVKETVEYIEEAEEVEEPEEEIEEPEEQIEEEVEEEKLPEIKPKFKKQIPTWSVQNVAVQTEPVIYNGKNKKAYNLYQAIAEILNRTE